MMAEAAAKQAGPVAVEGLRADGCCRSGGGSAVPRRLLLLGCSRSKREGEGLLPAVDRYDGPLFRVLRRYLRDHGDGNLEVHIISAEFGLIPASQPIPWYDRKLTPSRATEIQPVVTSVVDKKLVSGVYDGALAVLGRTYLQTIDPELLHRHRDILRVSLTSVGGQSSLLHDWLHQGPPSSARPLPGGPGTAAPRLARLRDVEIDLTPEQIAEAVRAALPSSPSRAKNYQAWFVEIDGMRFAAKWIVSLLTGLPVGRFTTDEARCLLTHLGIEVRRVQFFERGS